MGRAQNKGASAGGFDAVMGQRRGEFPTETARRAEAREEEVTAIAARTVGRSENISILPGGYIARLLAEHEYRDRHPEEDV